MIYQWKTAYLLILIGPIAAPPRMPFLLVSFFLHGSYQNSSLESYPRVAHMPLDDTPDEFVNLLFGFQNQIIFTECGD